MTTNPMRSCKSARRPFRSQTYPVDEDKFRRLVSKPVRRHDKVIDVTIPSDDDEPDEILQVGTQTIQIGNLPGGRGQVSPSRFETRSTSRQSNRCDHSE